MLLRGECVQDLRGDGGAPQRRRRGGAGQGLGGVREQQEAGGAAVEAEGGQGRGEARHLGLPRHPHLQTRPQARHQSVFSVYSRPSLVITSHPRLSSQLSVYTTHMHLTLHLCSGKCGPDFFFFLFSAFCVTFTSI